MADYTKQIFEMLGVEPEEEFKLTTHYPNYRDRYIFKFDKDLNLFTRTTNTKWDTALLCYLLEILTGRCDIVKIPHPTAEEQLAIDYARACGYKWIAKDEDEKVYAYKGKPIKKHSHSWRNANDPNDYLIIALPMSFIHWEDEEPFYIGQDETEEKEVCKYYSDGECMGQKYHPSVECKGDKSCCEGEN